MHKVFPAGWPGMDKVDGVPQQASAALIAALGSVSSAWLPSDAAPPEAQLAAAAAA